MIRLDRNSVQIPDVLKSAAMRDEQARLAAFYALGPDERSQRTYRPAWKLKKALEPAVISLSNQKCAYCETPSEGKSFVGVDSFRPNSDALNLDGTVSPNHYWWLMYDWENLVPACMNCNRLKGRRFPIDGKRAEIGATGNALNAETPLLIDPFSDQPADDLIFSEDGLVAGKSERGRISVEVYSLNREVLVASRRDALAEFRLTLKRFASRRSVSDSDLRALVADNQPFAGAKRQFLQSWLTELNLQAGRASSRDVSAAFPEIDGHRAPTTHEEEEQHFAKFRAEQTRQESYSVASEEAKSDYFIRTRYIERIEIENFRPIERLSLRFPSARVSSKPLTSTPEAVNSPGPQTPWLMLLGENGAGKSSVLQAVALCLLGNEWRQRVKLDAREFLRHGAETGAVRVFLTGSTNPITLSFSASSSAFESNPGEPKLLLLAYGSTRLLPRGGVQGEQHHEFAQTDNLFNPFVPLGDANDWLLNLDDTTFDAVSLALKSLLQLADSDRLVRTQGPERRVEADVMGTSVPLEELSDGYQSVLAVTCDIMRVLLSRWPSMKIAEGLVLLDEIGSHLHPRWRMRIVASMREIFPRVQFLVSTHDPLCLRGLEEGEVSVVRRDRNHHVVAITDTLPSIKGLRVDQLLTSEFFGLNSTVDPDLEKLFEEYYSLLAIPTRNEKQLERIESLRTELEKYRVLGSNRRERIMLEVIDEFLAKEPEISDGQLRQGLTEETKRRVRAIWDGKSQVQGYAAGA